MTNYHFHGTSPYTLAVIHGGPGASGEMVPVARELAADFGVIEPLQTQITLDRQVTELHDVLTTHAETPVTLIGFSWGAWLSYIVTARYPDLVKKLILVGSGPYQAHYADQIQAKRLSRLTPSEQAEYTKIIATLGDPKGENKAERFARLGVLANKTDRFDPLPDDNQAPIVFSNKFFPVLAEVQKMRWDGSLLELATQIQCPVVAMHGDYDPHPVAGVQEPLAGHLINFRLVLLENCGHKPWIERQAKDHFYQHLRAELHDT